MCNKSLSHVGAGSLISFMVLFIIMFCTLTVDFDECLTDAHGCEVNSTTCENTNGSFTCNCLPGLVKDVQNDRRCKGELATNLMLGTRM